MNNIAEAFDSPIDSDRHRGLALDCLWGGGKGIAGPGISGRYFLGMLARKNFFRESDFAFARALHQYFHEQGYQYSLVAFNNESWDSLVMLLKHELELSQKVETNINTRLLAALKAVLMNVESTNQEIALLANTTEKQVAKMRDVFRIRCAWKFLDRSKLYQQYLGES